MPIDLRNLIANAIVAAIIYVVARWDQRVALALIAYLILVVRDQIARRLPD